MSRLMVGVGMLLMVLMVFTPVTHNVVKLALAGILLLAIVAGICARGGRLAMHPHVMLWFLYYIGIGTFFVLRGILLDAPGAFFVAAIYVAFPALYLFFMQAAHDLSVLRKLIVAMILGECATGAYMVFWAMCAIGLLPASLFFEVDADQGLGIGEGWIQLRFFAISGLVFIVPFVISALVVYTRDDEPLARRWLWLALALGFCGAILSARKALLLTIAASPLVMMTLRTFLPAAMRAKSRVNYHRFLTTAAVLATCASIYLPMTGHFSWKGVIGNIKAGFDWHGNIPANDRYLQFFALVSEWTQHPLLGHGWGSGAQSVVRSNRPWEYELQYLLLLFSTGMIGFVLYVAGIVWIYATGIRIIRAGGEHALHMIPLLVGLTSILVAHATNPYLVSGGNMWMIFLPVAMINSWLLTRAEPRPEVTPMLVPARAA